MLIRRFSNEHYKYGNNGLIIPFMNVFWMGVILE